MNAGVVGVVGRWLQLLTYLCYCIIILIKTERSKVPDDLPRAPSQSALSPKVTAVVTFITGYYVFPWFLTSYKWTDLESDFIV